MPDLNTSLDDPMAEALAGLGRPVGPPIRASRPSRRASTFAPSVDTETPQPQPFKTKNGVLKFQPETSDWSLSRLPEVQSFYKQRQGSDLPVKVRGQGAIHNKWNLDHHDSADIGLNPNSKEGQALVSQLQEQNIPFLAFDHAIPGVATSAHIHIGRPSHRLGQSAQGASSAPLQIPSYDTALSPEEDQRYQKWKQQYAPNDSGADYDLRGAFKAGLTPAPNGHWPDTFKKPNHPTFSNESRYAVGDDASRAGRWQGETFIPPQSISRKVKSPQPSGGDPMAEALASLGKTPPTETNPFAGVRAGVQENTLTIDAGNAVPIERQGEGFVKAVNPLGRSVGSPLKRVFEKPQPTLPVNPRSRFTRDFQAPPQTTEQRLRETIANSDNAERDRIRQEVLAEREARQQGPMTEARAALALRDTAQGSSEVEQEVERRLAATQAQRRESERIQSQFTDADRAEIQDFVSHLRGAGPKYAGVRTGARTIGSGIAYKLAGATDLLGGRENNVLGNWLRRKALAGEISVEDVKKELPPSLQREVADFLTQSGLGLAEVVATPGGPIAKFAGMAGTEAIGRGLPASEVAKRTLVGGGTGALFRGAENFAAPAEASVAQRLGSALKQGAMVGTGTTGIELAAGTPLREAAQAGLTNAVYAGAPSAIEALRGSRAEQTAPTPAETDVNAQQRFYHRDWGEVVRAADQTGARSGRTKVYEADNPDQVHFPLTADLSGSGNQRMVPIRRQPEAQADPIAEALASLGARIHRTQEPTAGPAQFRGLDDSAVRDITTRAIPKGTSRQRRAKIAQNRVAASAELERRQSETPLTPAAPPDTGLRANTGDVPSFREHVENRPQGGIGFETLEPGSPDFNQLAREYTARYGTRAQAAPLMGRSRVVSQAAQAPALITRRPVTTQRAPAPTKSPVAEPSIDYEREVRDYLDQSGFDIRSVTSDVDTRQGRDLTFETAQEIAGHLETQGIQADENAIADVLYKLRDDALQPQATEGVRGSSQPGTIEQPSASDPISDAITSLQSERPGMENLLLQPEEAHAKTRTMLERDDPLNPKAAPLVAALNDAGVPTVQSGDLYGKNLVYVDLPGGKYTEGILTRGVDTFERALKTTKLPAGWKVIRADAPASTAFETGKPEKPYSGPRSTVVRLIRKGGTVTPSEAQGVAKAVKAALSRPRKAAVTQNAETTPLKTPGQKINVAGLKDAEVIDAQRLDGVDYELYKAGKAGVTRIYDADSGNVVGITKHPDFAAAAKAHSEAVEANGGNATAWRDTAPASAVKDIPTKVKVAREELPPVNTLSVGRESKATTERGSEINTRYAIVDLNDLVTSHDSNLNINPKFPPELQPRERDRVASVEQVSRIASKPRPAELAESPKASDGAMIIGHDGIVESGNGRVLGLRQMYERNPEGARAYKSYLLGIAERLGLDPIAIRDNKTPGLVRIRTTEVDRPQFVREANQQSVASMSSMEQARSDAKMLKGALLDQFHPSESGDIATPGNMNFVRAFMKDVVGPNELGRYTTASGQISQEGINRIRNGIFARAYGDSPEGLIALEKLAESPDNNVRNITTAMLRNAPGFASLKEGIDQGTRYPLDLSSDVAAAMSKMSSLRDQGMLVPDYLNQGALYGEDLTPIQKRLLQVFDENKRGANTIDAILKNYLRGADAAGSPDQAGFFGTETPSKADFLEAAIQEAIDAHKDVSPDLFAATNQGLQSQPAPRGASPQVNPPSRASGEAAEYPTETPTFAPRLSESESATAETEGHPLKRFDSTIDRLKTQEEEARQRLTERGAEFQKLLDQKGSELGASTIPEDLYDYVVIGASKLAQRSLNVAQFVDELVREFGEAIRKHARTIFSLSRKMVTDTQKEIRNERLSREIANRLFTDNVPKDQQREALRIAARFRTSTDTQGRFLAGFKSRVGEMAKSYGAAGGELTNRVHLGDIARGHEMEAGNKYLSKIQDVYSGVKNDFERQRISESVIRALEDRAGADRYLDTPEKKAVFKDTKEMLDKFRAKLNALGYETREDYFTHIRDVDILDQIISDAKDPKDVNLNDLVAAKSRFLQTRVDAKMEIKRDLPRVLFAYLKSVTKEIAYSDAVDYYYEHFANDIPIGLQGNKMDRAIKLMQNSLDPEKGRGTFYRVAGKLRNEQYRNFLAYNLKAAAQNFTQVDFARMRWTLEARSLSGKMWRNREALTGPLADAIDLASTEHTPLMRFLEQFKGDEPSGTRGRFAEAFNKYDPFQRSERRNWALSELGSIINSVVKRPEYKALKAKMGAEGAISEMLKKQDVFDAAVREASTTAAETQVASNPAMRGEFYDAPLHRIIGMFTAFKTRQLQILGEALGKHEGINGARAQTILRRGLSGDAQPVEVLREVETQRKAMETMLKRAQKFDEPIGVTRASMGQMIDHLKTQEGDLNRIIKRIEPLSGGRTRSAVALVGKYFAKVAAISVFFNLFWNSVYDAVSPAGKRPRRGRARIDRASASVLGRFAIAILRGRSKQVFSLAACAQL